MQMVRESPSGILHPDRSRSTACTFPRSHFSLLGRSWQLQSAKDKCLSTSRREGIAAKCPSPGGFDSCLEQALLYSSPWVSGHPPGAQWTEVHWTLWVFHWSTEGAQKMLVLFLWGHVSGLAPAEFVCVILKWPSHVRWQEQHAQGFLLGECQWDQVRPAQGDPSQLLSESCEPSSHGKPCPDDTRFL